MLKHTYTNTPTEKFNKTTSWLFDKIYKIDKPLAGMTKKEREKTTKIETKSRDITTNPTKIKRIIKDYYEKLHANKLDYLDEMDQYLHKN